MDKRRMFQETFGYEGALYVYTGKIFDLMAASVFWLLGCLPVITAGASFAALYAAVSRSVRRDEGTVGARFWKSFRQNLRPSLPVWLGAGGALFLLLLNVGIISSHTESLTGLFFIVFYLLLTAFVVTVCCYAFPALSRFDMPGGWIVKLALYLTVRHLPTSLLLLALFAAAYLLLLWQPLLFFIVPGVAALSASALLEPVLERHMPSEER